METKKERESKDFKAARLVILKELRAGSELQLNVLNCFADANEKSICEIIMRQDDFKNISVIMKALTAYNPSAAKNWLFDLEELFPILLNSLSIGCGKPIKLYNTHYTSATPEFILGYILGVFESVVWLDRRFFKSYWREDEPFKNIIMNFINLFMFENPIATYVDKLLPNSKFEGRLSNAIKTFVSGNGGARKNRYRYAADFSLCVVKNSKIIKNGGEEIRNLSEIGKIILDQFTIPTILSSTTTIGRARMVCDLVKKH